MANFIPMIAGMLTQEAGQQAQGAPPDGKANPSATRNQNQAQQPTTLNYMGQPAQSTGFMDMLASANMQGNQDLGRVQQLRGSRYPTQPMNDQNSWWTMYR